MNSTPNPQYPGLKDLEPQEVLQNKKNLYLIDVRREEEWSGELGHISGAKHIRLDTIPQRLDEIPKDKTLVCICKAGGRSTNAAAFLLENGYSDVYNMRGGMMLWNELGLETEN